MIVRFNLLILWHLDDVDDMDDDFNKIDSKRLESSFSPAVMLLIIQLPFRS